MALRSIQGHDGIWVQVDDLRSGIPEAVLRGVFERFCTTKFVGNGIGLDLSYSIFKRPVT